MGGASIGLENKDGWTAWHLAVRTGDLTLLNLLLATSPQCWNTVSKNGRTPLHTACLAGNTEVLDLLLSNPGLRCDINPVDSCGNTPLLEPGLDLDARDSMGRGVGQVAVQAGALECLNLCKEWGLLDDAQSTLEGQGLIHTAAREGQHEAIRLLIEWKVPGLDTRDSRGRTPLWLAVSGQHPA